MATEKVNLDEIEFAPLGEEPGVATQEPPQQQEEEETIDTDNPEEDTDEIEDQSDLNEDAHEEQEDLVDEEDQPDPDNDTENTPLYKSLVDKLGLELNEEEMETILSVEETDEGFAQVGATLAEKIATNKFDKMLDSYPEAKQLVEFQKHGGDPNEFFDAHYPAIDFNEVEIQEDDADLQKDVIAESLKNQGFDEEDIEDTIKDYEAGGLLNKQAKRSLKLLQKHQEKRKEEFNSRQEQLIEQRKQQIEEEQQKVDELITQEGVKGIQIPAAKRDKFKKYLYEPVTEDGKSQAIVDSQNMDLETRLLVGYLTMNDFNISQLVKTASKNENVKNLRDSLKNSDKLKDKGEGENTSTYSKQPNFNKIETLF